MTKNEVNGRKKERHAQNENDYGLNKPTYITPLVLQSVCGHCGSSPIEYILVTMPRQHSGSGACN